MQRRIILVFILILTVSALLGCVNDTQLEIPEFEKVEQDTAENIDMPKADSLTMPPALAEIKAQETDISLEKGASAQLNFELSPDEAWNKKLLFSSSDENVATVDENGKIAALSVGECTLTVASEEIPSVKTDLHVTVKAPVVIIASSQPDNNNADNGSSTTAALTYINGILIANKTYPLPSDYNPGVNGEAYAALMQMFQEAKSEGIGFWIASGFRSYAHQNRIYNNYVAQDGQAAADRYSARPGHSEHQTGLAFDLNYLTQAFGQSAEGIWLKENCHKYGFIIRYPEGKEHITGYMYEPWHVRYIGVDTATAVYESGLCLEEFLGITSVYAEQ